MGGSLPACRRRNPEFSMPALRASILSLACFAFAAPAMAAQEDEQVWLAQQSTLSVGSKLVVFTDLQLRFTDGADRLGQVLVRPAIGYRASPSTTLFLGYAYVHTDPLTGRATDEHRAFQQATVRLAGKPGKATLTARTRLEQRFVRNGSNMGWRLRQHVRLDAPTGKGPSVIVWAEPFVNLDTTDWGQHAGFDQLRLFGGLGVPVAKGIGLEAGYSGQYINRFARPDRMNHIGSLTLTVRR